MPFEFLSAQINCTDNYCQWMSPLTSSKARLVTSLGHNSDLIELGLETSSMMFFKKSHSMRFIRSIFPVGKVDETPNENTSVIGFKLAKKLPECEDI